MNPHFSEEPGTDDGAGIKHDIDNNDTTTVDSNIEESSNILGSQDSNTLTIDALTADDGSISFSQAQVNTIYSFFYIVPSAFIM